MNRERLFHTIPLRSLTRNDVMQLVSDTVAGVVDPKLTEMVYERTDGNPFFVEEVMRLLRERRVIVEGKSGWRFVERASVVLPESVKAVINERLDRLGLEIKELLTMASVIGREFSLSVLAELAGKNEDAVVEAIDQCEAVGLLLTEEILGDEVYAFAHDLTQETLYESIGAARRRRFHRQIAQDMEKVYAPRLAEWYDALAFHFLRGNEVEKALEYALKAGQRAWETASWERAATHFETARELLGKLPQDLTCQAQVVDQLVRAKALMGEENLHDIEEALELYTRLGDNPLFSRAV